MCLPRGERGIALVHVVLLLTIVTAVAGGTAMLARVEVLVSHFHRGERDAAYAAQAMLAAALQDLDRIADWNEVLTGSRQAGFADGSVTAPRQIPGGRTVVVCCGAGSMTARVRTDSGLEWRVFGWQSLGGLLSVPDAPRHYMAVWVIDDAEDADGDAAADNNNRLGVRAESITPLGVRRAVEVLVERAPLDPVSGVRSPGLEILSWHEPR